ncbi:MAG: MarR family transcriptional regulator [Chloroflexi bacterium]|nr:MarR family transcriptional regulator [Chloroflexota bacterium]
MVNPRTVNLLGALALAIADDLRRVTAEGAAHGAAAPAALVMIGAYPGHTIEELSHILQLSHSGTVRLVDRLAGDGLVERQRGADGRAVALFLTATGEQSRQVVLVKRRQILEEALQSLSPEEQTLLTTLIERVLTGFTRDRAHADAICRLCHEDVCPAELCPVEHGAKK